MTLVGPAGVGKTRLAIEVARGRQAAGRGLAGAARRRRRHAPTRQARRRDAARPRRRAERWSNGSPAPRRCWCSTTASTSSTRSPTWSARCSTRRHACASSPPARSRSGWTARRVHQLEPLTADGLGRAVRRRGPPRPAAGSPSTRTPPPSSRRSAGRSTGCRWPSSWPRPGSSRCRCARSPRRLDDRFALLRDPTSRRPERRRALAGGDRAGATTCCSPTTSGGCGRCRASPAERRSRPPSTSSPRSTSRDVGGRRRRPARRPLAGRPSRSSPDGVGALPAARQHPGLRARPAARGRACDDARCGGARRRGSPSLADRCAAHRPRPRPSRVPRDSSGPSGPTSTPPSPGAAAHDPLLGVPHRHRLRLDLGRARRRRRRRRAGPRRARRRGHPRRAQTRAPGLLARRLAGGVGRQRRTGAGRPRRGARSSPTTLGDDLPAGRRRPPPGLPAHPAGPARRRAGPRGRQLDRLPRALGLPWEAAASLAARGLRLDHARRHRRRRPRAPTRRCDLLDPLGDSWGLVHAEAMLGAIAQAEHRFEDAAERLARAAASPSCSASSARPPCTSHRSAVSNSAPAIPTPRSSR